MRKVVVSTFISVDGVMQGPGGPQEDVSGGFRHGGWVVPHFDEAVGAFVEGFFDRPYELLLGRTTYDIFAAHWPHAEDSPDGDLARAFNATRKYVATRSSDPLTWNNSVALHDAARDVARLKQGEGPDLLIQGSSMLVKALLGEGLLDEISLLTFPIILGSGKRLFDDRAEAARGLELRDSCVSSSGVVMSRYVAAGPVPTGDFTLEAPAPEEVERRERQARES